MDKNRNLTYISATAIVLLLFGLGGWYLYLRLQAGEVQDSRDARGLGAEAPSFFGSRGSTIGNILETIGIGERETDEPVRPPRLWKVHPTPVAGMGFIESTSTPILRYVDRSSGYVFEAYPTTGIVVRRTNTLMPQIYEAHITGLDGIIARSLDTDGETILTFSGTISTSTEDGYSQLSSTSLAPNILDIATKPSSDVIFYLSHLTNGSTALIRSDINGESPRQITTFNVSSWRLSRLADDTPIVIERPASGIPGHAYRITPTGSLTPILRNIPGLMALPHASSSAVLYSSDDKTATNLFLSLGADTTTTQLPMSTIAEKCTWNPTKTLEAYCAVPQSMPPSFVDRWVRGEVHSSDVWWRIEGSAGTAVPLYTPSENAIVDVERPVMDVSGSFIAFINAADKSLWVLRVHEN